MNLTDYRLSTQQRAAVESEDSSLLILAGPGTGKTRVIVGRMLFFLERGFDPESILALTFSKKATEEMEERLLSYRPDLNGRLEVSTMHSLCLDIVERHGFRIGLGRRLKLMTEAQSKLLFRQISSRLPLDRFVKSSFFAPVLEQMLQLFQECKDEGLWPEDLLAHIPELPSETEDELSIQQEWQDIADIYHAFQSYCFDLGHLDFGDAILCAVRILEDYPIVREEYREKLRAILVDEFQDTNFIQNKLIRLLASEESCQTTVVGDDDQAIYRFRGASYSAFRFFQEFFPNTKVVELSESYRLPPSVIRSSNALISANGEHRFRPDKSLKSMSESEKPVRVLISNSYHEEAKWIVDQVEEAIQSGTDPSEIAILVRAHSHAHLFTRLAMERSIPVQALSTEALFDQPIVEDLFSFFRLCLLKDESVSTLRLMDSPFLRLKADDIYKFCRWAKNKGKNYFELLDAPELEGLISGASKLRSFKESVRELSSKVARLPATELCLQFLEKTSAVAYLMENSEAELKSLAKFLQQLEQWQQVQEDKSLYAIHPLLDAIAQREINLNTEEATAELSDRSVKVLSIHASKGLEFSKVFICSLVGRRFPSQFRRSTWQIPDSLRKEEAPTKESHIEEERRLLYVGMTRAKQELNLTSVQKKGTKPSLFLTNDILAPEQNESIELIELPQESALEEIQKILQPSFSRQEALSIQSSKKEALRLSFTQLEKYDRCPLSYWFAYELRIPVTPSKTLVMGSCIHKALENLYRRVKEGGEPSKEFLIKSFENSFELARGDQPDLTEQDLEMGKQKLKAYYDAQTEFKAPLAIEEGFELQIGEHRLKGMIDRADGTKDSARIIDYKTGKSKSNENKEHQRFARQSLQFSIYALAAQEYFGWKVQELVFYYVYDNTLLRTERSSEELEETKTKILGIAADIQSQKFEASPGHHCRMCEYSDICPSALK